MAYTLIEQDGDRRVVQFRMEASELKKIFKKVRREISKELSIPGFRPGHIPDSIIDKRYGNLLAADVAERVHEQLAKDVFDNFDWILADDEPEAESVLPVDGEDYEYKVTYRVFETPEPVEYRQIKLSLPAFDVDKAVHETLENFRKQFVSYETTDQPSAENDMVALSYPDPEGDDDAEPSVLEAVIGQNSMGPGFDELITGLRPGDTIKIQTSVKKDEDFEPQKPVHTFTVVEVKAHSYPELDDEFAEKAAGFKTLDELVDSIRKDIEASFDSEVKDLSERQAIDALLQNNVFDVPQFMVENLTKDYMDTFDEDKQTEETLKAVKEIAEKKVREFLLLREIAIRESLEIPEDEISKAIAAGDSRSAFVDRSRTEKALHLVLDSAVKEEKSDEEQTAEVENIHWKWVPAVDNELAEHGEDKGDE